MNISSPIEWIKQLIPLWGMLLLLGAGSGVLKGESAHYSFDGTLQGELPLEVEFLSLARKHGLNVRAMISGSLAMNSSKTLFDPLGTSSVELKLILGEIQELSAHVNSETFYRGTAGNLGGGATVQFGSQSIVAKDPNAFPSRIGLPSPTQQDTAFVLEGIVLQLDPSILAQFGNGTEAPEGTLQGKLILKKKGGKNDGETAELDFAVSNFRKQAPNLWDSQEWRSVATVMQQMSSGYMDDVLPIVAFNDDGGDLGGGDDLIVIPEPASIGLFLGFLSSALVLVSRRRPRSN